MRRFGSLVNNGLSVALRILPFLILFSGLSVSSILKKLKDIDSAEKLPLPLIPTFQALCHLAISFLWVIIEFFITRCSKFKKGNGLILPLRFTKVTKSSKKGPPITILLTIFSAAILSLCGAFVYTGVANMDPRALQCIIITNIFIVEFFSSINKITDRTILFKKWISTGFLYIICIIIFLLDIKNIRKVSIEGIACGIVASLLLSITIFSAEKVIQLDNSLAVYNLLFAVNYALFSYFIATCVLQVPMSFSTFDFKKLFYFLGYLSILQALRCIAFSILLYCHGAVLVVQVAACSTVIHVAVESSPSLLSFFLVTIALFTFYFRNQICNDSN